MRGLVPDNYAQQGCEALAKRQKLITSLLSERRLPARGWDTASIEHLLQAITVLVFPLVTQHASRQTAACKGDSWRDGRTLRRWTPTIFWAPPALGSGRPASPARLWLLATLAWRTASGALATLPLRSPRRA